MTLVDEWYSKYQEHIVAIYAYGSRILPYIRNPHDYDYLVFAKDYDSFLVLCGHSWDLAKYGIHLLVHNTQKYKQAEIAYFDYLNRFVYPIIGFYDDANFNVLMYKQEYEESLRKALPSIPFLDPNDEKHTTKRLYHILTGLFILENYSYKLTAAQEKIINLAHDGECPRQWYEWAYKKLGLDIRKADPKVNNLTTKRKKFVIRNGQKVWLN